MPASLVIMEMQNNITTGCHPTPVRAATKKRQQATNTGENVGQREPLYTFVGVANWYGHYGKQYAGSLKS